MTYPLKEFEELAKSFKTFDSELKKQQYIETKSKIETAREEGFQRGLEHVRTLVKFLYAASWRRQNNSSTEGIEALENAAFETLLGMVYIGDEVAVEAVKKLASGSLESVEKSEEGAISYAKIKELSSCLDNMYFEPTDEVEAVEITEYDDNFNQKQSEEAKEDKEEQISEVVKIPSGGIKFLNDSELGIHI